MRKRIFVGTQAETLISDCENGYVLAVSIFGDEPSLVFPEVGQLSYGPENSKLTSDGIPAYYRKMLGGPEWMKNANCAVES